METRIPETAARDKKRGAADTTYNVRTNISGREPDTASEHIPNDHSDREKPLFTGAATALITPFQPDGSVDFPALGLLLERQIAAGIDALVLCGTTGESAALTEEEHCEILRYAARIIDGRVPLIAGCGSCVTAKAVALAQSACASGADGLLAVTPYYNKATPAGLVRHFTAIADASAKPILLYNVPSRTGVDIPLSVYRELSKHPHIVGVKEASGNLSRVTQIAAAFADMPAFSLYSGCDELTLPILSLGGRGVISVVSHLLPREVHLLCERFFRGDAAGARELQLSLLPLIETLFMEVNPIPVKTACSLLGFCHAQLRLPLCAMEPDHLAALQKAMADTGLL